jgi:hypothetical protein
MLIAFPLGRAERSASTKGGSLVKKLVIASISATIVGIGFGAAEFDVLHAQRKPPAYVIT